MRRFEYGTLLQEGWPGDYVYKFLPAGESQPELMRGDMMTCMKQKGLEGWEAVAIQFQEFSPTFTVPTVYMKREIPSLPLKGLQDV